ncbi:hypothetical protein L602_003900000240 [Cupriavidus gilardii J11]|uniref:Regulatory protein, RpfE type n=1 Tax=Cupriavidus gilardii J11 TaxID=936133 RepID=A0A562BAA6_9BURK|nr:hypothetical protein [Cupriavidus gilardii]TWG82097.1 hypothetical protein L602_003900000240 [Cupriavidus gilardii J11]
MMTHLTLIVPFSVPPGADADPDGGMTDALLRQLELPALGKLLTRGAAGERERHGADFDPTALRSLPHERWLAARAGLDTARVPTAPYMRLADHADRGDRTAGAQANSPDSATPVGWACLQPVHIHAARDHLVLMDPARLDVSAAEADALRAAIEPLLTDSGIVLDAPHPARWYVPDSVFGPLDASAPLRAAGRNIDVWMQSGARERDWRRLQNEIQMTWFDHPVNQAREAAGALTINSVWLHGMGVLEPVPPLADRVWSDDPLPRGLALAAGAHGAPLPARLDAASMQGSALALADSATTAYIAEDWARWIDAMHAIEADWFAPALDALEGGQLQALTLVLAGDHHYAEFTVRRADLRKFWRGIGSRGDWRALLSNLALAA